MMEQALGISLKNLSKSFAQRQVIENLNLDITPGSFVSIVGPSGCGKSTLLRLIAGLEKPTHGEVILSPTQKNLFGFVFQDANLIPWRNVYENVALPFELNSSLHQLSKTEIQERVLNSLKKVHLLDFQKSFPHELSGGMRMRVSLARALVNSPRLLLLDEPFAALDENTRFEMQDQLHSLWQQEQMTVIFVTHSLFESTYLSERVVMLKGPGAKIATDQIVNLPKSRTEEMRTSEALNNIVKDLSSRLRK